MDHILDYFRYRPPLATDKPGDEAMAEEMLRLSKKRNTLKDAVKSGRLRTRVKRGWLNMDAAQVAPDFPTLSEADIRGHTYGVYQLRQAKHYTDEHLENGKYIVST